MNVQDLGDPALGTPNFTLTQRAVINNKVRLINMSSAMLRFVFPVNGLDIRVPPKAVRLVQLVNTEHQQIRWQVMWNDPTFIGVSDVLVEVFADDEFIHPFEMSGGGIGPNSNFFAVPPSLFQVEYKLVSFVQTPNTHPIVVTAPATGLYQGWSALQILDANTSPADELTVNWQKTQHTGPGLPAAVDSGYATYVAAGTLYEANGTTQFPGQTWLTGTLFYNQIPQTFPAFKGDTIQMNLIITGLPGPGYANNPDILVSAGVILLAIS